jgi:hypothetical protein
MTSPPRRPIISLKFKRPDPVAGDLKPAAPVVRPPVPAAKPPATSPSAPPPPPAAPPPTPAPAQRVRAHKKGSPSISPDLFKAAIKAAGLAIQNVVADPEWKSEDLFRQYQAAKEHANSTHKHQAKLVSTVATRRHNRDIEQADVESAAMRAAYAAALVALVDFPEKHE